MKLSKKAYTPMQTIKRGSKAFVKMGGGWHPASVYGVVCIPRRLGRPLRRISDVSAALSNENVWRRCAI